MELSSIYQGKVYWVMVYDTGHQPDVPEVEMVDEIFFDSPDQAHDWFAIKYKYVDFINPRAVSIKGFDKMIFVDPLQLPIKER